jgi:hypothetical protein
LAMKDLKSVFLGVLPQPMFFECLLDLVVSSEWCLRSSKPCVTISNLWFLRSSKPYVAMAFAGAPFSCCLSSVFSCSS